MDRIELKLSLHVICPQQHTCPNKIKEKPVCWILYFYYTAFVGNFGDEDLLLASDLEPKLPLGVIKTLNKNRIVRMPINI